MGEGKKKAALLAVWLEGRTEKRAHPVGSVQYFVLEQTPCDCCIVLIWQNKEVTGILNIIDNLHLL